MRMRALVPTAMAVLAAACSDENPTVPEEPPDPPPEISGLVSLERLATELLEWAGLDELPGPPASSARRSRSGEPGGPALAPLAGPVSVAFDPPSPSDKVFVVTNGAAGMCLDGDSGHYRFLLPLDSAVLADMDTLFAYGGTASVNGSTRNDLYGDGITAYAELHRLRLRTVGSAVLLGASFLGDTVVAGGSSSFDTIQVSLPVTALDRSLMQDGDTLELEYFGRGAGILPSRPLLPLCGTVSSANVEWEALPRNAARATLDLIP